MAETETATGEVLRDLGDGLVMRRACKDDAGKLAAFNGEVHRGTDKAEPDQGVIEWTRDLMLDTHPTFRVGDFILVEDMQRRKIVSSVNLISQTWSYAGIKFKVGRPELVGTHPDYRRKGLVRAQFDVLHQWSAERGEVMQAITGIPNYYRQFGYEMVLDLDSGRFGYPPHVPKLKDGD